MIDAFLSPDIYTNLLNMKLDCSELNGPSRSVALLGQNQLFYTSNRKQVEPKKTTRLHGAAAHTSTCVGTSAHPAQRNLISFSGTMTRRDADAAEEEADMAGCDDYNGPASGHVFPALIGECWWPQCPIMRSVCRSTTKQD